MFSIRPIYRGFPRVTLASRSTLPFARAYANRADSMATISAAITKDHRELERYYREVIENPGNHDHQQRYGNQFTWELARHSIGEELVVYPAFESYLGEKGKKMAEEDRAEHRVVKERLKDFQKMESTNPHYIMRLKELWLPLCEHMKGEEEKDLVSLEGALRDDPRQSEELANSFGRTKMFVPTRSHPSAGEHPPFETVMGLLTAPFDRISDLFRKYPKEPAPPVDSKRPSDGKSPEV